MGKYLDFYKKCMETGEIPLSGLCENIHVPYLFEPTFEDCVNYQVLSWGYWARDGWTPFEKYHYFGPTRQNIILFLAAMNGEFNKKSNPKKRYGK